MTTRKPLGLPSLKLISIAAVAGIIAGAAAVYIKETGSGNGGGETSYWPNSKGSWTDHRPDLAEPPLPINGDAAHWDHCVDDDHYEQPGDLFRLMTPEKQQLLFENTARAMGDARIEVKRRHVENCAKADPAYGAGVEKALGL